MAKIVLFFGSPKRFLRFLLRKSRITLLFGILSISSVLAQQLEIKGNVLEEESKTAVIGATIRVKGQKTGTVSDTQGIFKVKIKAFPATLIVSSVGFRNQEIEFYEATDPITVYLADDQNRLSQLVVVGYGTQKRSDLTGAISSINTNQLKETGSTSFVRGLQGLASGVQVSSTSGAPGATSTVRIRGGNSITGGNDPLYVIDGFPIYNNDNNANAGGLYGTGVSTTTSGTNTVGTSALATINPGDIESIEVLKDASATAIYGSRGANGVIIVTTKRGQKGSATVTYDGSYGVQNLAHKIDLMNAQQFALFRNAGQIAGGRAATYSQAQIDNFATNSTDWQDLAYQTAPVQNHQLSVSGGNDKTRYSSSLGYLDQQGILINTDFKRYTGRISVDSKLSEKFNFGLNLNESYSTANLASSDIVSAILQMPATVSPYAASGGYTSISSLDAATINPIAYLKEATNQSVLQRTLGNAFGEYELVKGLKAKILIGIDLLTNRQYSYLPTTIYGGASSNGVTSTAQKTTTNWVNENTLTYTKSINDIHNFDLLAGFTQQQSVTRGTGIKASGFPSDDLADYDLSSATTKTLTSSYSENKLLSYLGRLNYNYRHKYFLTGSLRADGSSRLGANNRWGYFPSGSLGWQVDKEKFFKNIASKFKISNSKIRLGYGKTGNSEIDSYKSQALLTSTTYPSGTAATTVAGYYLSQLDNPDLKWETTNQYDVGIDLGFLNERIKFTGDLYYKKTYDLLVNIYVPNITGYKSSLQNLGVVQNKGIDLSLTTDNVKGKFTWTTNATFSINRNKVLSLGSNVSKISYGSSSSVGSIIQVGQPLGVFYGLKTDGLYSASEIADYTAKGTLRNLYLGASTGAGDVKYVDVDHNGVINDNDQTIIGNPNPKFIFGFNNTFSYKNFDLSIIIQGSVGNKINSYTLKQLLGPNGFQNNIASFNDYYSATNTTAKYQRPNININQATYSDLYIFDGSYARLQSLSLGYILPKSILSKLKVKNVKLYVTGQNLFTLTKYPGYDPDVNSYNLSTGQVGTDYGSYPTAKTFLAGATITF